MVESTCSPENLIAVLEVMLTAEAANLRKGDKVSLIVSDSWAALVGLPWHEQLTAPREIREYALACFEQQGLSVKDGWVMHAEFRAPGSMGLAYALPDGLVAGLVATLKQLGLQLDRVLPVMAQAYWCIPSVKAPGNRLALLRERDRIGAMMFDRSGLQAIDVESVTGDENAAGTRLLRRMTAYFPSIEGVFDWSPAGPGAGPDSFIATSLPDVPIVTATRNNWS